jgi:hypothetical protein
MAVRNLRARSYRRESDNTYLRSKLVTFRMGSAREKFQYGKSPEKLFSEM